MRMRAAYDRTDEILVTTTNGSVRLSMSTSLDGYIAGPGDRPGQERGRRGG
jgi:hypothetical protein